MSVSTIRTIKADGSFNTDNGRLYAFFYSLEDGTQGVANHKTERSPFHEGDEVEYMLNGETKRGDQKLKLSRPQDGGSSQSYGSNRPANGAGGSRPAPAQQRPAAANGTPLGVTVGMAINNAALDMRYALNGGDVIDEVAAKRFLWKRASLYLHLSQTLERGNIDAPASEPVRTQIAPPNRTQAAQRPGAGDASGAVSDDDALDPPF